MTPAGAAAAPLAAVALLLCGAAPVLAAGLPTPLPRQSRSPSAGAPSTGAPTGPPAPASPQAGGRASPTALTSRAPRPSPVRTEPSPPRSPSVSPSPSRSAPPSPTAVSAVSPLPVLPLRLGSPSAPPTIVEVSPVPTAATGSATQDPLGHLAQLAVGGALVLGLLGGTGLWLTRAGRVNP